MRTLTKLQLGASIATMMVSLSARAYPGESIVQDANGDYTITYKSSDESATGLRTTVFVPSTKIAPSIRSSFRLGERGTITYRYTVSNGATAKQAIVGVWLEQIVNPVLGEQENTGRTIAEVLAMAAASDAATLAPSGWDGDIIRDMSRIAWDPKSGTRNINNIQSGRTLTGFGFASLDLPSMSVAHLRGIGGVFGYPDEGPAADSAVLAELNRLRDNDFIARPAAVPTVAVPAPFDAAVTLDRIQTQMHTWIGMQLLDSAFSAQLDRYFQSAINACRLNQPKVGKQQIETMRALVKKEQPNTGNEEGDSEEGNKTKLVLIDKLAASVLDFDLNYVMLRMEKDEGEHAATGNQNSESHQSKPQRKR